MVTERFWPLDKYQEVVVIAKFIALALLSPDMMNRLCNETAYQAPNSTVGSTPYMLVANFGRTGNSVRSG